MKKFSIILFLVLFVVTCSKKSISLPDDKINNHRDGAAMTLSDQEYNLIYDNIKKIFNNNLPKISYLQLNHFTINGRYTDDVTVNLYINIHSPKKYFQALDYHPVTNQILSNIADDIIELKGKTPGKFSISNKVSHVNVDLANMSIFNKMMKDAGINIQSLQ